MHVLILGCGPSGLVAAHAAHMAGHVVTIWSKNKKSPILGAQFLHADIPGVNTPLPSFVKWVHHMDADGEYNPEAYLRKVYGPIWDGTISHEMYNQGQTAWDLREVYTNLWNRFEPAINDWTYSEAELVALIKDIGRRGRHVVINTLPRNLLCREKSTHSFVSTNIWAMGDDPMNGQYCPISLQDFSIEYNGNQYPSWYRASKIFGFTTMEWPGHAAKPPVPGVVAVQKPVSTTCNCWPLVAHVGRYGQWRKGVLLHHVYEEALDAISFRNADYERQSSNV